MSIVYRIATELAVDEVIDLYRSCSLGARRPVDDRERMGRMLQHANLVISAWDGEQLVGISRSLTDFAYCTYLSDLAGAPARAPMHERRGERSRSAGARR